MFVAVLLNMFTAYNNLNGVCKFQQKKLYEHKILCLSIGQRYIFVLGDHLMKNTCKLCLTDNGNATMERLYARK